MPTQLYLIAPPAAVAERFAPMLAAILANTAVAALLLPRGDRTDPAYEAFAHALVPVAQQAGCAVLVEGAPALVGRLGADGLHVGGPTDALRPALAALQPDHIVGTGPVTSPHDAMTRGELGPDYIMFGPLSGAIAPEIRELAGWWAEAMVIPSVLSDPQASPASADAAGCEFLAIGESVWRADDPAAAVAAIAAVLERQP